MTAEQHDEDTAKRRGCRRIARRMAALFAILVLALLAFVYYHVGLARQELAERQAAMRAAGYPATQVELDALHAELSRDRRAYDHFREFARLWEARDPGFGDLEDLNTAILGPQDMRDSSPETFAAYRTLLDSQAGAMVALYKATDEALLRECLIVPPLTWKEIDAHRASEGAGLALNAVMVNAIHAGDMERAVDAHLRLVRIAPSLHHSYAEYAVYMGNVMHGNGVQALDWLLENGGLSETQLAVLAQSYDRGLPIDAVRRLYVAILASHRRLFTELLLGYGAAESPWVDWALSPLLDYEGAVLWRLNDWLFVNSIDTWWELHQAMPDPPTQEKDPLVIAAFISYYVARERTHEFTECATEMSLAQTAIAVKRFEATHGRLPVSIDDVAEFLPDGAPIDPYSGHTVRYRVTDGGAAVYSIGVNGKDDGGERGALDIVFTVTTKGPEEER